MDKAQMCNGMANISHPKIGQPVQKHQRTENVEKKSVSHWSSKMTCNKSTSDIFENLKSYVH